MEEKTFLIEGDSAPVRTFAKSSEWYTPLKYIGAVTSVLGCIDVDPASCELANQVVRASVYYDIQTDGLAHDWPGRVYLNPPYGRTNQISNQDIWLRRLQDQRAAGITREAIVLVNASTDAGWFQQLWDYAVCLTDHRINFWSCNGGQRSTHGSAFAYFGEHESQFIDVFSEFGPVFPSGVAVRKQRSISPSLCSSTEASV
jgi:hypothetical protein